MTLHELAKSLHNCQKCKLAKLGRTQVVFGAGNPHASIMFVGEAPGFNEDQKGEPFGQHGLGDAQVCVEIAEPANAVEGITHDQPGQPGKAHADVGKLVGLHVVFGHAEPDPRHPGRQRRPGREADRRGDR